MPLMIQGIVVRHKHILVLLTFQRTWKDLMDFLNIHVPKRRRLSQLEDLCFVHQLMLLEK